MGNHIHKGGVPDKIIDKMRSFLIKEIDLNQDLLRFDHNDLEFASTSTHEWMGTITATGIITYEGVKDIEIKSIDSITATVFCIYQKRKMADIMVMWFSDDNIIIPDFNYIMTSMNLSVCDKCHMHKENCKCKETNHRNDAAVKEILKTVRIGNLSETRLYDPDNLITERSDNVTKEAEKHKVDIDKFEPIIAGISTTMRYNIKKVRDMAIQIVTSKPDIPDNILATEIMKNLR